MLRIKQNKFLTDVALLIQFSQRVGFEVTTGELYRPQEMQDIYLKKGLSKAKYSQHQKRLAIDLNFFVDGQYIANLKSKDIKKQLQKVGDFWESLDEKNRWGGNFKSIFDPAHFERLE